MDLVERGYFIECLQKMEKIPQRFSRAVVIIKRASFLFAMQFLSRLANDIHLAEICFCFLYIDSLWGKSGEHKRNGGKCLLRTPQGKFFFSRIVKIFSHKTAS